MSKRLLIFAAVGVVLGSVLAGAYWTSKRAAEDDKQELLELREAAHREQQARLERLQRKLKESEQLSDQERRELERKREEEKLNPEHFPPQYRPRPRPYLDPSRNPPKQ
jgi:hypothetical protein